MKSDLPELSLIKNAIKKRDSLKLQTNAFRLFNGFYEGFPGLFIDSYGKTLVFFDHDEPGKNDTYISEISHWLLDSAINFNAVLVKQRQSQNQRSVNGKLVSGNETQKIIREFDVKYALDLQLNQDASFYLDTRLLRRWLLEHTKGLRVLNTFAYTGSLGIAAGVGGASIVVQTDLNHSFLKLAQRSGDLNHLKPDNIKYITGDFFRVTGKMRNSQDLFDCIILDPPYFSITNAGRVDLQEDTTRLINKVRPLVAHEGWLIVINNALFLSGEDFVAELNGLCQSPYLAFEQIIPVPTDVTGCPETIVDKPPVDPSPFNHPTKIAVLKVYRKDRKQ